MILTSTTESVPYTPSWKAGKDGAPIFFLRAGGVIERGQLEAELAGPYRAGMVAGYELRQAMRTGVSALVPDHPDHDHVLALINAEEEDGAEPLSDDDKALFAQIRGVLGEHWPEYRDLVAQLERRRQIAPLLAFRRFCTGWSNVSAEYARGLDGLITEAALAQVDPFDMISAGNEAYGLLYGAGTAGNSARPSPSDDGQATSSSDGSSTADGKLTASDGPKTPAPPARRGRSRSSTST